MNVGIAIFEPYGGIQSAEELACAGRGCHGGAFFRGVSDADGAQEDSGGSYEEVDTGHEFN